MLVYSFLLALVCHLLKKQHALMYICFDIWSHHKRTSCDDLETMTTTTTTATMIAAAAATTATNTSMNVSLPISLIAHSHRFVFIFLQISHLTFIFSHCCSFRLWWPILYNSITRFAANISANITHTVQIHTHTHIIQKVFDIYDMLFGISSKPINKQTNKQQRQQQHQQQKTE